MVYIANMEAEKQADVMDQNADSQVKGKSVQADKGMVRIKELTLKRSIGIRN